MTMTLESFISSVNVAVADYGVYIAASFVFGAIAYLVRKLSKSGR